MVPRRAVSRIRSPHVPSEFPRTGLWPDQRLCSLARPIPAAAKLTDGDECLIASQISSPPVIMNAARPLLVQICGDVRLAWTRRLLIEWAGFRVRSVELPKLQMLKRELACNPVVVLICQTVHWEEAAMLSLSIHNRLKGVHLMRITATEHQECGYFACTLKAPVSPMQLTRELQSLHQRLPGELLGPPENRLRN